MSFGRRLISATSLLVLCFTIVFGAISSIALAQPTYTINYQGKLTDPTGLAVADGTYNMRFWLLQSTGVATTSAVWTESRTAGNKVTVENGLFSVQLGSVTSLASVNFNQTLYLGVEIGGASGAVWDGEMLPRKIIGTVPSAFEAKQLGGVASTSFLRSDTADSASGLLTFNGGLISNSSSTLARLNFQNATGTSLYIGGDRITDFVGTGLSLAGTTLTLNATGAWTGTFDGQEGSYYLANAFSTTSANYWEGTQTSRLSDDLTNNSIEDLNDVAVITENLGDLLYWNGSAWADLATSSLNVALANTTGTLGVTRGGTGLTSASTGDLLYASSANTLANRTIGSTGQVLQVVGGLPTWVATSSLGITGGGGGSFLSLTDTPNSFTAYRVPFTNSGATALTDDGGFLFNGTTDTLTIGTATFASNLITFASSATTTVPNNNPYAFTIATSSTARPLFRIDTTSGGESVSIGTVGGDVYIGGVGSPSDLVFEESSTISGQGTNTITLGETGDIFNVASGVKFGVATTSPWQEFSVNGDIALTGRIYDSLASAGTNGMVLQTTGTATRWVATSSLGIGVSEATIEGYIFDGDNSGTLSSGTLALDSLSYSGTVDDLYVNDAITVAGGSLGSNTITSGASWATAGTFTIGDGGDRIDISSNTWDVTNGVFTDVTSYNGLVVTANTGFITSGTWNANVITSSYLDAGLLLATELDTCAEFAGLGAIETGTCGSLVLSASPSITGTLDVEASDFSGTMALSGTTANIALGSNWLSGDGSDEGIYVDSDGDVAIGTTAPAEGFSVRKDTFLLSDSTNSNAYIYGTGGSVAIGSFFSPVARLDVRADVGTDPLITALRTSWASYFGTADTEYGNRFISVDGGATSAGTDTTYGIHNDFTRSGATGGVSNNYGLYTTMNSTFASGSGTIKNYGNYIDLIGNTTGTSINYGLYVNVASADTNYAGIFTGGNFGIGTSTPSQMFTVGATAGSQLLVSSAGIISDGTWQGDTITATYLDSTVLLSSEIDTSSELATLLTDETGTGRSVFSISPAFSGTPTFATLTATSTVTLSGTAANIALGSNWLSGDGGDEGIYVDGGGDVSVGASDFNDYSLRVVGTTFDQLIHFISGSVGGASHFNFQINDNDGAPTTYGLNTDNSAQGYARLTTEDGTYRSAVVLGDVSGTSYTAFGVGVSSNSGSTWSPGFVLQQSGNFGIGTSTPSQMFTVGATAGSQLLVSSAGIISDGTWQGDVISDTYINDSLTIGAGSTFANNLITPNSILTTGQTDEYCLTYEGTGTTFEWQTCAGASGANTALSNLASVAINTSLLPGSNDAIDLGSDSLRFRDLYLGGETLHIGTSLTDEGTLGYTTATNLLNFSTDSTSNGDIAFFSDDLYLDKSSGYVGIGDSTPSYMFDVAGDFNISAGSVQRINGVIFAQASTTLFNYFTAGAGNLTMTGDYNTATGLWALSANTTGYQNTANGSQALLYNTTGDFNTATGLNALHNNTTADGNTATGHTALNTNTVGSYNTANGVGALYSNTTGNYNIAIGVNAGRFLIDGTSLASTSDNSIFLGPDTRALTANDQNSIVIGTNANGLGSNTVVLGNDAIVTTALKGNVGIGDASPSTMLDVAGEITSQSANAFRMIQGNYGSFFRNDGSLTYLLLTASGDQYGSFNSLRPLYVNNSTGNVGMENGLTLNGTASNITLGSNYLSGDGGDEGVYVDANGQTGVGFTPNTNQGTLQVYRSVSGGSPATSGTVDSNQVAMLAGGSVQLSYGVTAAGTAWLQQRSSANFSVNYGLALQPNGGNVGIGTTTPSQKLTVFTSGLNDVRSQGTTYAKFSLKSDSAAANTRTWQLYNRSTDGSVVLGALNDAENAEGIGLQIDRTGNTPTQVLFPNGSVGIGDTTPAALLTVGSGDLFQVNSAGAIAFVDSINITNDTGIAGLKIGRQDNTNEGGHLEFVGAGSYDNWNQDSNQNNMRFFTNSANTNIFSVFNTGAGVVNMTVDGTITASANITGNDLVSSRTATPTTGTLYLGNTGTRYLHYDGTNFYLNGSALNVTGSVYSTTGGFYAAGASEFSGNVSLMGTTANIALGSNYLSGDGGDEGVSVDASGSFQVYDTQTLGSTAGNNVMVSSVRHLSSNVFMHNEWSLRDASGSDWSTQRIHDGLSVDASYLTPGTDTRTWWERDPNDNVQSWGDQASTYLTIRSGNVGIGDSTPDKLFDVEGNAVFGSGGTATGAVVDIGSIAVDYPANNGSVGGLTNLALQGLNTTSIGFHDSAASYGALTYTNNTFAFDGASSWGPVSLGINDRTPDYTLDVAGTLGVDGDINLTLSAPTITTGGSYVVIPNGLYVSGGTPYFANTIQARGGINNDTGTYLNISGGTSNLIYMDSDTGIGRTDPQKRLDVFETVADSQFRISYDASQYTDFRTDSGGNLVIDPTSNYVVLPSESLYVCNGGSCASTPNGNGTITSERAIVSEEGSLGTTGSISLNWDDGNQQRVNSSTGNMTFTFSNATAGQTLRLVVCYGGGHTITWGSTIRWANATVPTPTSTNTKCDVFSFLYTGTEYLGQPSLNF